MSPSSPVRVGMPSNRTLEFGSKQVDILLPLAVTFEHLPLTNEPFITAASSAVVGKINCSG